MRAQQQVDFDKVRQCVLCKRNHSVQRCHRFRGMSIEERRKHIRQRRYCSNCLARSHQVDRCSSLKNCRFCGQEHHSLLHLPREGKQSSARSHSHTIEQEKKCRCQHRQHRKGQHQSRNNHKVRPQRREEASNIIDKTIQALKRLKRSTH